MKGKDAKLFKKHSSRNLEDKAKVKINEKATNVTIRLYQRPLLLPETRDFYGNRSSLN